MSNKDIARLIGILKHIETNLAKPYFSNLIRYTTGIKCIGSPNFHQKKKILLRLLTYCIYNLVPSAQIKTIQETHKKISKFTKNLKIIHFNNFDKFQNYLGNYVNNNKLISQIMKITIDHDFFNKKVFETLQHFKGIGPKNSALFWRFILRYTGVFQNITETNKDNLVIPLDRILLRFYKYYTYENDELNENITQQVFDKFQEYWCGKSEKKPILVDNLWLIGHFYGNLFKEKEGFDSLLERPKNSFLEELEFYIFKYPYHPVQLKNSLKEYL